MKNIIIDITKMSPTNNGVFEGWGTSLCWWAHRLGYDDELAQKSADLFYSKDGLGLNIMRYNIGGGDDPSHNHITRTDSKIPGWVRLSEKGEKNLYSRKAYIFILIYIMNVTNIIEYPYIINKFIL